MGGGYDEHTGKKISIVTTSRIEIWQCPERDKRCTSNWLEWHLPLASWLLGRSETALYSLREEVKMHSRHKVTMDLKGNIVSVSEVTFFSPEEYDEPRQ